VLLREQRHHAGGKGRGGGTPRSPRLGEAEGGAGPGGARGGLAGALKEVLVSRSWIRFGNSTLVVKFGKPILLRQALEESAALADAKGAHGGGRGSDGAGGEREGLGGLGGGEDMGVSCSVAGLSHRIVHALNQQMVVLPTTLVATVLITLSCRGISLSDLVAHVHWLQGEIMCRGGLVAPMQDSARAVGNAVRALARHVQFPHTGETLEPLLRPRHFLENRHALASLRNKCVHLFVQEALVICALVSRPSEGRGKHWVRADVLRTDTQQLADILKLHFTYPQPAPGQDLFDDALHSLSLRGALMTLYDDGFGDRVQLLTTTQARRLVQLLRGIIVPLLDAYWVAALSFLPLQNEAEGAVIFKSHLGRMQRIANTMYLENKVHSLEAAAEGSLINAVALFELDSLIHQSLLPDGQVFAVRTRSHSPTHQPAPLKCRTRR
jgi:glycerol-3-phosphate O-acyltransferase